MDFADQETMDHDQGSSSSETVDSAHELLVLAANWTSLTTPERREQFQRLTRTDAEELFLSLSPHDQAELIDEATNAEKRSWVRLLAPDDVADLIQEIGPESRDELLPLLDPQTKREVTVLLAYAEDNAGGLMSSRFVRLRPEMSVDEAISYLRLQAKTQVETILYGYVLRHDQVLEGVVSFRELFSALPSSHVRDIMTTNVVTVPVDLDQEQIAQMFQQQGLLALPVTDEVGHMKGIITLDDVADTIREEATEDMQKIGAVESLDAPYMKTPISELVRKRAGWLSLLFVGGMFTTTAMGYYHTEIEKAVVLALFIPLVISSGGNTGSQASTLIIRAMALGEVRMRDWSRVLAREIVAGISLGLILGGLGFLRILLWPGQTDLIGDHSVAMGLTILTAVLGVVVWGTISGSMLPFILKRFKLDPASASAPLVSTLVDISGLVIYFTVAGLFLKGRLL